MNSNNLGHLNHLFSGYNNKFSNIEVLQKIITPEGLQILNDITICYEKNGNLCSCGSVTDMKQCDCGYHKPDRLNDTPSDVIVQHLLPHITRQTLIDKLHAVDYTFVEGEYSDISAYSLDIFAVINMKFTDRVGVPENPDVVVQRVVVKHEQHRVTDTEEIYTYRIPSSNIIYGFQLKMYSSNTINRIEYATHDISIDNKTCGLCYGVSHDGYRLFDGEVFLMSSVNITIHFDKNKLTKYRNIAKTVTNPVIVVKKGTFAHPELQDLIHKIPILPLHDIPCGP